ncbi:unnamed protein product [Cochlearia groenlandica]
MQKHKCKLCCKTFCNGRALGGHMKSHLISPTRTRLSVDSSSSSSSSLIYGLRENPRKSLRVFNPEPTTVYNSETETEPEPEAVVDPVRKRARSNFSKKKKKKRDSSESRKKKKKKKTSRNESPASSVSDGSPEQDLAMCLMMLSRDSTEFEIGLVKPEKRCFTELRRRCLIDLNLPPPEDGEAVPAI